MHFSRDDETPQKAIQCDGISHSLCASTAIVRGGCHVCFIHFQAGKTTYTDPGSGYTVFTEVAHKKRGRCCGNACRHVSPDSVSQPTAHAGFSSCLNYEIHGIHTHTL